MSDPLSLKRRLGLQGLSGLAVAAAAILAAAYYFAVFLYISLQRIHYPFALDWVEGDSLVQVSRLLNGQMLYAQPNYQYVALAYPPLYYYISALFARVLGLSMFPLRLVSLLSSLACMGLIYLICRRAGARSLPALLAAGLFAAAYQLTGTWFDVGRTDMLAMAFILGAVYFMLGRTMLSGLAAGLSAALACLTKQTHIFTLLFLLLFLAFMNRRGLLPFAAASLGFLALAVIGLDRYYAGWFRFFTITSAFGSGGSAAMTPAMLLGSFPTFWLHGILLPLPIVSILAVAYGLAALGLTLQVQRDPHRALPPLRFAYRMPARAELQQPALLLFAAAGMVGTAWGSVAHQGSFQNDLIPAVAALAILLGVSIQRFACDGQVDSRRWSWLLLASILQLALLYYPIGSQIPTRADFQAGQALVAAIRLQPGPVYVGFHPELMLLAGKPLYASWDSLFQLEGNYGGGDPAQTRRLKAEFSRLMARQEFSMIILDKDLNWIWGHPENYYYMRSESIFPDPDVFWPVTGWQVRPAFAMLPIAR